jgi:hypothetical protein
MRDHGYGTPMRTLHRFAALTVTSFMETAPPFKIAEAELEVTTTVMVFRQLVESRDTCH